MPPSQSADHRHAGGAARLRAGRRRGRACAPRARRRSRAWRSRAGSRGRRRSRPGCPTACRPGRPGRAARAAPSRARLPPKAASGMPPPMTLPNTLRSGAKPGMARAYRLCAPPSATRKPVITSSKTSSAPCARAQLAQALHEGHARAHEVHVAGDRLDHRRRRSSSPWRANASSSAATLLYSRTSVCWTTASGTPALVGWPKVARPEPALTSSASAWPW